MSIKIIDPTLDIPKSIPLSELKDNQIGRSITSLETHFLAFGGSVFVFISNGCMGKVEYNLDVNHCIPMPKGTQILITSEV